jgi:cation diffusion facilitator CzcD-associated flavoprotein CzcO
VTEPIREVRGRTIVTSDGTERELDAIICATGFEAADAGVPFELRGRAGQRIEDEWKAGIEAYLGTAITGFPNLFFVVGPNTGLGHSSMILMMESLFEYVLGAVRVLEARGLRSVEVRDEVQRRYNERLQQRLAKTVWNTGGCSSWYLSRSGKNTTLWPGFTFEFRAKTRRFDDDAYVTR